MKTLTNSEIKAAEINNRPADLPTVAQVSLSRNLSRSHVLVWRGQQAEVRDQARNDAIVFRGSRSECDAYIERKGL